MPLLKQRLNNAKFDWLLPPNFRFSGINISKFPTSYNILHLPHSYPTEPSASEMTCSVSSGALNSTHSLTPQSPLRELKALPKPLAGFKLGEGAELGGEGKDDCPFSEIPHCLRVSAEFVCRCIHLSNNSIQKHHKNGERAEELPDDNMWHCDDFKEYLKSVASV